jgi:pimeloyl-ACP methyl ester carboxylesterase
MIVRDAEALSGTRHPFDEAARRAFVRADLARTANPPSLRNHTIQSGGDQPRSVRDLAAPLLVIHGSADPLFPLEHGVALAEAVPGATLVTVEGGGHELHEGDWDRILDSIVAHTRAAPPRT